ncbi:hypothetical protein ACGFJC_26370 [Nonomuraea fuscirosea]|jgi:hypothetical protein|uniref:Uncharacterized protein n=1 Tax=Nonomuraea fuscirosea TaxID=1291556 RepID=A0A2T0M514_9ACTN|nr:hypothetical protein [Nonomuraea fuscirosea]PRX52316.1 hypothetical protein B0I32_13266 [Nonomuraea fuscirosea]WSA55880.1 hypothetical protein OIE67_15100 [Nonomuraea fuscirosea]
MADTKKKPASKSGKSKKQAIKTSRQAKETKRDSQKPSGEE